MRLTLVKLTKLILKRDFMFTKITRITLYAAFLGACAFSTSALAQNQTFAPGHPCIGQEANVRALNIGGGLNTNGDDGIEFIVDKQGKIQINAYGTKGQVYHSSYCTSSYGISLVIIDNATAPATTTTFDSYDMEGNQQSLVTGSGTIADPFIVTTSFYAGSDVTAPKITRIDSYIKPQKFVTTQIKVANLETTKTYKLFYHVDSYLSGGDTGNGFASTRLLSNGMPAMVGVKKQVNGSERLLGFKAHPSAPWDAYYSGYYSTLNNQVSVLNQLSNTINTAMIDNGFGVQWTIENTAEFDSGPTSGTFNNSLIEQNLVFTPASAAPGDTVTLTIEMDNKGIAAESKAFSLTLLPNLEYMPNTITATNCLATPSITSNGDATSGTTLAFSALNYAAGQVCTLTVKIKVLGMLSDETRAAMSESNAPLAVTVRAAGAVTAVPVNQPWMLALLALFLVTGIGLRRKFS